MSSHPGRHRLHPDRRLSKTQPLAAHAHSGRRQPRSATTAPADRCRFGPAAARLFRLRATAKLFAGGAAGDLRRRSDASVSTDNRRGCGRDHRGRGALRGPASRGERLHELVRIRRHGSLLLSRRPFRLTVSYALQPHPAYRDGNARKRTQLISAEIGADTADLNRPDGSGEGVLVEMAAQIPATGLGELVMPPAH